MKETTKLKMLFADNMGVLASLASLMAREGFNIIAVEVERGERKANIYLEAEGSDPQDDSDALIEKLKTLPDLLDVTRIETLPQEKREMRMQILLDSVADGIFFIDEEGVTVLMNEVARKVLDVGRDIIGSRVTDLPLHDYSILECLHGSSFVNVKKDIITETGRLQFFVTCRPITNASGRIVGAVEIMKDMKEIKVLASAVIQPVQITFSDIVGESRAIKEAIGFAQKIARTDSSISLQGESGTGKELFAAAIHHASGRSGAFVPVNCAALPEALLESELFGYVGGAFTGARKEGRPGLFEAAREGTIFLDEITELPLSLQAKLLRALQDRMVRRIGDTREIPVNARVITATNIRMEQMVRDKQFRDDLYYRINVLPISLPPLRERQEDVAVLAEHFMLQLSSILDKSIKGISREAMNKLRRHHWPGNVRELRNVIERAAILCTTDIIDTDSVIISFDLEKTIAEVRSQARGTLEHYTLHAMLDFYERQIIEESLGKAKSIRKAALTLGISHTALLNKLKKYKQQLET